MHERPTVNLRSGTPQNPLKNAKGQSASIPLQYGSTGKGGVLPDVTYHLEYTFSSEGEISADGDHANVVRRKWAVSKNGKQPQITDPGLYTITGVSTEFCKGEVLEPASCLLQNPPEPKLSLSQEEIFDKCAGSPIGLRVDLDLIGTPPFEVRYRMTRRGDKMHTNEVEKIAGLRGQIELTPKQAGHYTYEFLEISDYVYKGQPLKGILLEQDVKPSASARIVSASPRLSCIDDAESFEVMLQGEGPFSIEYELVHGGRRSKHVMDNIDGPRMTIDTPRLTDGGDYTLALASVTDAMGCKEFLNEEARISVRHQRPKVGFRSIDGNFAVSTLEGKKVQLPLRLEGEGPFTIKYLDSNSRENTVTAQSANDRIDVNAAGLYQLIDIRDRTCPGVVDEAAKSFEVSWIPRPAMRIRPSESLEMRSNTMVVKKDVCEDDEDDVELLFKGAPPFHAHYIQQVKPLHGTMAPKNKEIRAATDVTALRMDTSHPGSYEYKFSKLEDANYDHSTRHFAPLTIQQRVNAKPSAAFKTPGTTYSFCSVESDGEEVIPITLHGAPPFDLEVEIKHHGSARPETVSLTGINSHSHSIRIPHSRLHLGKSSVALRRVSDKMGCARTLDSSTPRVQISVHDAPTITPMEAQNDFCVGDRINFALSGVAPFNVFYTFEGAARKAVASTATFRRLAEKPGTFAITGIQDSASSCRASTNIPKHIHGMPSVRVSKGRDAYVDIHEGGEAEMLFEFGGVPPFEFTYTRSSNTEKHGKKPGVILDMHSEVSDTHSMRIRAHEEGTYEVVSIKDRYCAYAKPGVKVNQKEAQKRLTY